MSLTSQFSTHEVQNQPEALKNYNVWATDTALREAVTREGAAWAGEHLGEYGARAGGDLIDLGFVANENKPKLRSFDRYGHRIDEVEFHPAYHALMTAAMEYGMNGFAWRNANREGAHVARAAVMYIGSQAEAGIGCPMSMTYAAIPALRHAPTLAEKWIPKLISTQYDPRSLPMEQKTGCTIGMGMTEKQGGSDVRSNTTRAIRQPDGTYELVGHKWFFSAPMCDAHLVLAQTEAGLSCFLVPRFRPDGSRNAVEVQRLKDKLGDWANASSEVEFQGAFGELVGEEGRGVATIIEMVALTRLDCMIGSSSQMRQATVQALNHTRQRQTFGKHLIDQPLMRNVLADLALESEAAIALTMRIARAIDSSGRDENEAAFARIATAIGKYWICKRTPSQVNEAQECLGGIGYVEETMMPRLYRQAPLNSIWEGSGNVQCLDVLRALRKEPASRDALFAELAGAKSQDKHYDAELARLGHAFDDMETVEYRSRFIVERTALMLQASILIKSAEAPIAACFCRSRLGGEHGLAFGTLGPDAPVARLIERASAAA
ncbi:MULTISPECIES: isovaleryl-CoA dehydrogenase [Alphaproteobacteria]|uniref:Acyl-CoA dehydrogenase n=2 Tax=Alphaproteobacteria TaxID=28211 RepID=A0A512HGX5_9HYPH|nr:MULTISPECIES: isovaleryl-CoA dehydrogenase [Alphaproteobacteria]GEO84707.1 acyl-CoA dehydrogenase [Ciceribacter naphthalenivorans]GLR20672.1 acyl-CoA dehydrogenase [Ciceribacter naphthalenivorans]GLT03528.1 acyl-CoA dehydrogenase [Sphingomonas psychrolutea]